MSKQRSRSPEPGLHMIPLLSPLLISAGAPSAAALSRHGPDDRASRSPAPPGGTPMLYSKMQAIVQKMLHSEHGVPIKSYKRRLISAIPCAFTGADAVAWLMNNVNMDSKEAIHYARMMVSHGYFFSVEGSIPVRDDGTLFRFQTPYYWPSQNPCSSDFEYGVYLVKQVLKSKHKIRLMDYELTSLHKLKPKLANVWRKVTEKAEEAVKICREQKRVARAIINSQEEAFWRLHRPAPTESCVGESLLNRHFCHRPPWQQRPLSEDYLRAEAKFFRRYSKMPRVHISIAVESIIGHCNKYREFDPMLTSVSPSNPWISGDNTLWDVERSLMEQPSDWQLRRWACLFPDLLNDVTGRFHFEKFCKSQYCSENIKFWQACRDLRSIPLSSVESSVQLIYDEYLQRGASNEVNVSAKVQEEVERDVKLPSRYSFTAAQEQIYQLMQNDIYPRFIKSAQYTEMVKNAATSHGKGSILSWLRVTHNSGQKKGKSQTLTRDSNFTSPCLPERFTRRHLSISHPHNSSSASMDDIFLSSSTTPLPSMSPHTAEFIDALMAPGGRRVSSRRDSAPITSVVGVQRRSNGSSMDQVFEEEEEGQGEGRRGVGVEPVLATSYSANDVNNLAEEASLSYGKKLVVPSVTKNSGTENLLKVNGAIPSSRSIPYQLSEQKETLLHLPDFMPPTPKTPALDLAMSPRGTSSFEFESINLHKHESGVLGSTESLQSTASN